MQKWFADFWQFFQDNYAAIIAVASLTVAVTSLFFTIDAQRVERNYKEISIRPELSLKYEPFQMIIKNVGLGPARIGRTVIKTADGCVDSKLVDAIEFERKGISLLRSWASTMSRKIQDATTGHKIEHHLEVPMPESVMAVGDSLVLYRIENLNVLAEEWRKKGLLGMATITLITESSPVAFEFCSLTDKYCRLPWTDRATTVARRSSPPTCF